MRRLLAAAAVGVLPPQPPALPFAGGGPPGPAAGRWWLENDGFPVGVPDADVDAARAWAITQGDPSILVAIVDSGVDVSHPLLAGAIRQNTGEIPGNLLDDDGNGYADDVTGWDFADGDPDVLDPFPITHGTLVAGLVAAQTIGLAPGVSLLPVKVFSDSGLDPAFEDAAADGIRYAIDEGARVIQIAWELSGAPGASLDAAFAAAEAAGIVVVVAAGNAGQDLDASPAWPASYPNALAVAGTDRYDRFVELGGLFTSAFGAQTVPVAAPTEKLRSTLPGGGENLFSGTSAAAPLVAAAAALVLSVDPSLTPAEVRALLAASADPLPSLEGRVSGGRLNAGNAVRIAAGLAAPPPPRASLGRVERAEPDTPMLFDGRSSSGAMTGRFRFTDRAGEAAGFLAERRFRDGGLWPATLEVEGPDGLTHTAHTETAVAFRGVSIPRSDESLHPYPPGYQFVTVSVPGANALRLHFPWIGLAAGDALVIYDREGDGVRALEGSALGREEVVRGDRAYLYLLGYTGGGYGFALDRVDAAFDGDVNHAPLLTVAGASAAAPGTAVRFDAEASDPDGDAVTVTWRLLQRPDGSDAAPEPGEGNSVTLVPDARGDYALVATASDGASETTSLTWLTTRERDTGSGCRVTPGLGSGVPFSLALLASLAAAFRLAALPRISRSRHGR